MTTLAAHDHPGALAELGAPLAVQTRFYAEDTVVVTAVGEIDASTAGKFDSIAVCALTELSSRLVFDLTGVGFLGVSGLRTLATTVEQARPSGIKVLVAGAGVPVRRALALLDEPPPRHDTLASALRAHHEVPELQPGVLDASAR